MFQDFDDDKRACAIHPHNSIKNVGVLMSFWTLGCNNAHLLAGDDLRSKNQAKTIIHFFHVPNVKAEQKPGVLKPNISTIKSNSPPKDRFMTGSLCLCLFF